MFIRLKNEQIINTPIIIQIGNKLLYSPEGSLKYSESLNIEDIAYISDFNPE